MKNKEIEKMDEDKAAFEREVLLSIIEEGKRRPKITSKSYIEPELESDQVLKKRFKEDCPGASKKQISDTLRRYRAGEELDIRALLKAKETTEEILAHLKLSGFYSEEMDEDYVRKLLMNEISFKKKDFFKQDFFLHNEIPYYF